MKTYSVTYTKKIGGIKSITVKANDEHQAIANAKNLCYTGRDFRDPVEISSENYTKPSQNGYQGSERQN